MGNAGIQGLTTKIEWKVTPIRAGFAYPCTGGKCRPQAIQMGTGIQASVTNVALILSQGQRLVYEKPLYRTLTGTVYSTPFEAVWQSESNNGGKTWSAPIVTDDARIFDLGKGWAEQS